MASYNIRFLDLGSRAVGTNRSLENWNKRRDGISAILQQIGPDLVAFQEMESWTDGQQIGPSVQQEWLSLDMSGFGVAAGSIPGGQPSGQPIFYRRDRFALLDYGALRLDSSFDFSGAFPGYSDMVTWVRLFDSLIHQRLTVVNLHLHFSDRLRRIGGARMGLQIAHEGMSRGDAVVVLGDLNAGARARPAILFREGGLTHVPSQGASYHFNQGLHLFRAIDHIFHGPGLTAINSAQFLRDRYLGLWPSDHYPIWADILPV